MEITGHDTIFPWSDVRLEQLRAFVDALADEWPGLLVSDTAAAGSGYHRWPCALEPTGELYVVRDREMELLQAEAGYAETADGASPVAVYYHRTGPDRYEITLVTAAAPARSAFAARVLAVLRDALAERG